MRCLPSLVALSFALLSGCPAEASSVASYTFEDGGLDGWIPFFEASLANTTAAAFSGSHSLLTTNTFNGLGGPVLSLTSLLSPGATYAITGHVRLTPGESAGFAEFTMIRSDPACSSGTCFDTINEVPVSGDGWTGIGGSYTVSSTETALQLYAHLVGPTNSGSFYLDDVAIDQTSSAVPEPASLSLFSAGLMALALRRRRRSA